MANEIRRWTLEELVSFEQALASSPEISVAARHAVELAVRGHEGAAARRVGFHAWLGQLSDKSHGQHFTNSLAIIGSCLAIVLFVSGIGSVVGLLDGEKGGINVTLFLCILLGGQWLILIATGLAWILRGGVRKRMSGLQMILGKMARRLAGMKDDTGWQRILDSGNSAQAVILWRFARLSQTAGIAFNIGILSGLLGLVLVRHVGFYWESTTVAVMGTMLESLVNFLSAPWAHLWSDASLTPSAIAASRWLPGAVGSLPPGPAAWWKFLLMATVVWGLLPRIALWLLAHRKGNKALASLDFQARHHREFWRTLVGTARLDRDEKPLDGVLVLDVGGSGLTSAQLRPFMLQHLRVQPTAWYSVAVLDEAAEQKAVDSMSNAPAGVVLLAEGWSLAPARIKVLHAKIRDLAGSDIPIKILVSNIDSDRQPSPASEVERREWTRFVDTLRDPLAEVYFFELPQLGL